MKDEIFKIIESNINYWNAVKTILETPEFIIDKTDKDLKKALFRKILSNDKYNVEQLDKISHSFVTHNEKKILTEDEKLFLKKLKLGVKK